jgi:hypothetical protein
MRLMSYLRERIKVSGQMPMPGYSKASEVPGDDGRRLESLPRASCLTARTR